jgi:hypothetical protein
MISFTPNRKKQNVKTKSSIIKPVAIATALAAHLVATPVPANPPSEKNYWDRAGRVPVRQVESTERTLGLTANTHTEVTRESYTNYPGQRGNVGECLNFCWIVV